MLFPSIEGDYLMLEIDFSKLNWPLALTLPIKSLSKDKEIVINTNIPKGVEKCKQFPTQCNQ
jgi:hypothetical protein